MRQSTSWNNAIWCVNALLALGIIGFSFKYIFLAKSSGSGGGPAPGLSLSSDGRIHGTPTAVGTFYFTVRVADSEKRTANRTLRLTVTSGAPGKTDPGPAGSAGTSTTLAIDTTSLPGGAIGQAYSQELKASGGVPPYSWEESWPENPPPPAAGAVQHDKGLDEFQSIWKAELVPQAQAPVKPAETWPSLKYDGKFGKQYLFKVNGQDGQGKVGTAIEVSDGQGGWNPAMVNGKKIILKEVTKEEAIFHLEDDPAATRRVPILDQEGGGATPGPPPPEDPGGRPGKAPQIAFGTKEIADQSWKVDPRERDFVRANAKEMMKDVKWSLYGVEDGRAKGVRIEGFTPGSYAEEYAKTRGIQAGDIVMTVNGRTIDGASTVNELFGDGETWEQGQAQVEVERSGKVQVLSYTVK